MNTATPRYPHRITKEEFFPLAYYWMFLANKVDEKLGELFKKRYVKGTVTVGVGNEATGVGMALPFRRGKDVLSLLHRDVASHIIMGDSPFDIFCQFMANADSPTHAREGNAHHGNAFDRRFPMISHLGSMLSLVVGGVWSARQNGEDVFGLAVIGDGGTSKGEFHESVNLASVKKAPVLFMIENNHYAYSTPTRLQYNCELLSSRAAGYGIQGKTIDGTDVWEVYSSVCDALDEMSKTSLPYIIESMTLRLEGHAVYDKGEYVTPDEKEAWAAREPMMRIQKTLRDAGFSDQDIRNLEQPAIDEVETAVQAALKSERPKAFLPVDAVFAPLESIPTLPLFNAPKVKNINAVNLALEYIMQHNKNAVLLGLDIGPYGSAFKTCKGLFDKFGENRVLDLPISESAITGFALGASQTGIKPIVEFQFADFGTENVTQLGLNCGTWFFRTNRSAPTLFRFPCGGGITLGAFHSGEFEGLWSRFCGLKLLYPCTPQETFEALVAGFYDPNPCLIFEHKLMYASKGGDISFDGDVASIWRERQYAEGTDCTIVATGAMCDVAILASQDAKASVDIWNPFILSPLKIDKIIESVKKTGRLLVVQESTQTAGLGDRIISLVCKACFSSLKKAPVLLAPPDMPVPFAPEMEMLYRPARENVAKELSLLIGD